MGLSPQVHSFLNHGNIVPIQPQLHQPLGNGAVDANRVVKGRDVKERTCQRSD